MLQSTTISNNFSEYSPVDQQENELEPLSAETRVNDTTIANDAIILRPYQLLIIIVTTVVLTLTIVIVTVLGLSNSHQSTANAVAVDVDVVPAALTSSVATLSSSPGTISSSPVTLSSSPSWSSPSSSSSSWSSSSPVSSSILDAPSPLLSDDTGYVFEPSPHKHAYTLADVLWVNTSTSYADHPLQHSVDIADSFLDCHEFDRPTPRAVGYDDDPNAAKMCRATSMFENGNWKCPAINDTRFAWRPAYRIAQSFMLTIREPMLVRTDGMIMTTDQAHGYNIPSQCGYTELKVSPLERLKLAEVKAVERAISLTQFWGKNYFHFLAEVLPRWILVPEHIRNDSSVYILVDQPVYQNMGQFLEWLGVSARVIQLTNNRAIHVTKELYFPQSGQCKENNPLVMLKFKDELFRKTWLLHHLGPLTRSEVNGDGIIRNILWMRRDERGLNDNDRWFNRIKQHFVNATVHVHDNQKTLNQTANMFYHADMIIGPHGAGFANTLFTRVGTVVVEFLNKAFPNYVGYHFSHTYGLPYYMLISRSGEQWNAALTLHDNEFDQLLNLISANQIEIQERIRLRSLRTWTIHCDRTRELRK